MVHVGLEKQRCRSYSVFGMMHALTHTKKHTHTYCATATAKNDESESGGWICCLTNTEA